MKVGPIKEISFDEMTDLPDTLYKYRIWGDQYQKTILTERVVYMAAPTSFEDKKDCKLLKRYDLMSETDIYQKYLNTSKQDNPSWTRQQHRSFAREWTKKSPMKNKEYLKVMQEEHFIEYDKRFGVLSLTANNANIEMWNKYSNNGLGFCVGFYPKILFNYLGGGGSVHYFEELPDINHDDEFSLERYKQIFFKERKWEFEQEYRTHKFYQNPASTSDRQIKLPADAYKEIIFGWEMNDSVKNTIREICNLQDMRIEFKESKLVKDKVEIFPFANSR